LQQPPECCSAVIVQEVKGDHLEFTVILPNEAIIAISSCGHRGQDSGVRVAQRVWRLWNEAHSQIIREGLALIEAPRIRFCDGMRVLSKQMIFDLRFSSQPSAMSERSFQFIPCFLVSRFLSKLAKHMYFTLSVAARSRQKNGL